MIYAEIVTGKTVATMRMHAESVSDATDVLKAELAGGGFLCIAGRECRLINVAQIELVRVFSDREDGT